MNLFTVQYIYIYSSLQSNCEHFFSLHYITSFKDIVFISTICIAFFKLFFSTLLIGNIGNAQNVNTERVDTSVQWLGIFLLQPQTGNLLSPLLSQLPFPRCICVSYLASLQSFSLAVNSQLCFQFLLLLTVLKSQNDICFVCHPSSYLHNMYSATE